VLVLSCLYCSGLFFYCGYVPLVLLFWLRLPLLFFVFSTSVLVLSISCGESLNVCMVLASVFTLCCGGIHHNCYTFRPYLAILRQ
jgi:hypothetical protein